MEGRDYTNEREKLLEDLNGKGIDYIIEQINIMKKREELENSCAKLK